MNSKNKITSSKNNITNKWASANSGLAQLGFSVCSIFGFVLVIIVFYLKFVCAFPQLTPSHETLAEISKKNQNEIK